MRRGRSPSARETTTTRAAQLLLTAGLATILAGCRDTAGPRACTDATTSVSATVSVGAGPSFDWQPRCAVALLLVEDQDGSDQWSMHTAQADSSDATAANRLVPPVRYGVLPAGTTDYSAATLLPGRSYNLVLWRVMQADGSMRPLTVQSFTR